jgi:hypothetical protein
MWVTQHLRLLPSVFYHPKDISCPLNNYPLSQALPTYFLTLDLSIFFHLIILSFFGGGHTWALCLLSRCSITWYTSPAPVSFHLNGIIQHVTFMFGFLHIAWCFEVYLCCSMYYYFLPFYDWILSYYSIYHCLVVLFVSGDLGFFNFLTIVSKFFWPCTW